MEEREEKSSVHKAHQREIPEHQDWRENPNGFQKRKIRSDTKDQKFKKCHQTSQQQSESSKRMESWLQNPERSHFNIKLQAYQNSMVEARKRYLSIFEVLPLGEIWTSVSPQQQAGLRVWVNQKRRGRGAQETGDPSQKKDVGKSWALAYNRLPEKQSRVEQQDKGLWKRFHKKEKIRKIRLSDVIKYLENIYDRWLTRSFEKFGVDLHVRWSGRGWKAALNSEKFKKSAMRILLSSVVIFSHKKNVNMVDLTKSIKYGKVWGIGFSRVLGIG